jgi:uncharacterized protein (TIGR03435 family)
MKKIPLCLFALAAASGALFGQNLTGSWQGSLQGPQGGPALRIVVKITRADDESLKATLYSIDQGGQPINASSATQQGSTLKLAIAAIGGNYEGKLGADGATITGTWSQAGAPAPLNLARATPETAWAIPEPAPPPKLMAAGANPSFEVATIKPSDPASQGASMLVGRGGGNLFTTTNSSLSDLITFAYGLHARQVTGGPAWMESDKFDVTAKPDQEGVPNVTQLRTMVQKLLVDRFQLTFHHDKKELSVYAITVAKTGPKMAKSQATGNLPGFGGRGPGNIGVRNTTMAEFAEFLQSRIVDRPVVDQSGLTDRYDFPLVWTPDGAQTGAPKPDAPPAASNPDDPPDLFTAFQQQLGLKLEATKAPVDVFVIDKVEKPSAN